MFDARDGAAGSTGTAAGASFDAELANLAGGVRAWAGQDLSALPVVAIPRRVEILLRARNEIDGELLRGLEACDRSGEAARLGGGSTVGWLSDVGRIDPRHAATLVRTARGLADRLPATARALSTGDITLEHARVLNRAVTPARVALAEQSYAGGMAQAEDDLLTVAILAGPEATHRAARTWAHTLDPQAEAMTQAQQHQARELYLDRTFEGMLSINGRLDREAGDVLLTAIGALTGPRTASSPTGDLSGGPPGDDGGGWSADTDQRTGPQRRADALVELCHQVLAAGGLPDVAGERPHLSVTVSLESLEARAGASAAELGHTGPVAGETARRLACDASISRVVTDGPSQIMDVGRRTRVIHPALRRALVVRDGGCVHPGCDRPPSWTEGHHRVHWADGGPTDLDNLILLCRRHHRAQHEGGRTLRPALDRPGYYDTYRRRTQTATQCATCRPLPHHQPRQHSQQQARHTAPYHPGPDDPF